jgi:hypothetical protein
MKLNPQQCDRRALEQVAGEWVTRVRQYAYTQVLGIRRCGETGSAGDDRCPGLTGGVDAACQDEG